MNVRAILVCTPAAVAAVNSAVQGAIGETAGANTMAQPRPMTGGATVHYAGIQAEEGVIAQLRTALAGVSGVRTYLGSMSGVENDATPGILTTREVDTGVPSWARLSYAAAMKRACIELGVSMPGDDSGAAADPLDSAPFFLCDFRDANSACTDTGGGTPAGNGAAVAFARDKSAFGNHLTQPGVAAQKPTRQANKITSDGVSDALFRATLTGGTSTWTLIVVGKADNAGTFATFGAASQFGRGAAGHIVTANAGANLDARAAPDAGTVRAWVVEFAGAAGRIECGGRRLMQGNVGSVAPDRVRLCQSHTGATTLLGELYYVAALPGLYSAATKAGWQRYLEAAFGVPWGHVNASPYSPVAIPTGKLMAFGDSITEGIGGAGTQGAFTLESYRVRLFELARAAGKAITFVGSQLDGPATVGGEAFPRNHAGVGGNNCQMMYSRFVGGGSPEMNLTPEGIMLWGGTNDSGNEVAFGASSAIDAQRRLGDLLDEIRIRLPDAQTWVATVPPANGVAIAYQPVIERWNASFGEVVQLRVNAGHRVTPVDLYAAFVAGGGATPDGVHPDDATYRNVIAPAWWSAISAYMPNA